MAKKAQEKKESVILSDCDYQVNHFRYRQLKDKFIATTDAGSWALLDKNAIEELKEGKVKDKKLFTLFEEKGLIVTKNNRETIKNDLRKRYSFLKQGTSLHIVVVTLRCNQRCVYCQASSRSDKTTGFDMDEKTAKKTVEFIFQSQSDKIGIEFQGGEPLLNFNAIKLISEYARKLEKEKKKDLIITLVTNLTLMNEKIMEYCIKNRIFICTSLDGPKNLHDKNRWLDCSSYELATKWIKRIDEEYRKKKINNTQINALITVTKETLKYPKEVVDEYISLGFKGMHLRFLSRLGYADKNKAKIEYSPEEFNAFWKTAADYIIEKNKQGVFFRERMIMIILKKITEKYDPNYLEMRSPCGAVIGQMTYNYNGDIYSCDEGRMLKDDTFKLGNVKRSTYSDVISSPESCAIIAASINDSYICEYCAYKPYCGICPVCSYAEQGTTIGIIPQTTFCKVYKAMFDYVFEKFCFDKDARKVFDRWLKQ